MNLAGWPLADLGLLFAAGGAAITALYLLRMRRREVIVPFAALWQRVTRESDARRLWRHLRRILSWLLQLLILAAIVLAIGDPRPDVWLRDPITLAIVVDRSASMGAPAEAPHEPGERRLDRALARARAEIAALGPSDRALVIAAGPEVTVPAALGREPAALLRGLSDLSPAPGEADLGRALALARHALDGQPGPRILLLTDGAVDDPGAAAVHACADGPIPCQVALYSGRPDSLAITAFAARRYPGDREKVEVLAEVRNLGDADAQVVLEVQADGLGVGRRELTLGPGEERREILGELDAARARLVARLLPPAGADPAILGPPGDDIAYAIVPPLRPLQVALVTDGTDLFLEAALLTLGDHVQLQGLAVADYAPDHPAVAAADLLVVDAGPERLPAPLPAGKNLIVFDPWRSPDAAAPIPLGREVARPFLTEQAKDHPILRGVVLKDVNLRRGTTFAAEPGDEPLIRTLGEPIAVLRGGDASIVAFGFDPRQSDLPLRTAFPVLVANLIDHFERAAPGFVASVPVGARRPLDLAAIGLGAQGITAVEIHGPEPERGADPPPPPVQRAPVEDGIVRLRATAPGVYTVRADGGPQSGAAVAIAVNQASAPASDLHDRLGDLPPATDAGDPPAPAPLAQGPLWTLLLLLAAAIVALEWATYHRRWTV